MPYWHKINQRRLLESFKKTTELNPNNADAFIKLGKVFSALGRKEEADESYKSALALNPIQEQLATAMQHFTRGETEEAEQICREALKKQPDDVNGLRLLASIASKMEQKDDAIVLLERAVELKPKFAGAWGDLAESYTEIESYGKSP